MSVELLPPPPYSSPPVYGRDARMEQVTSVRHQQEDARKRLVDAFSAMSAYIQRYRCQQSEFDLGAALMNPMADCECDITNAYVTGKRTTFKSIASIS